MTITECPGGEIGRRKGLKIPRSEISVPVRLRPRAPLVVVKSPIAILTTTYVRRSSRGERRRAVRVQLIINS